jgi:hypothetical protein
MASWRRCREETARRRIDRHESKEAAERDKEKPMTIRTITFQATDNADYYRITLAGLGEVRVLAHAEHALTRADAIRAEWAHLVGLKSREKIAAIIQRGARRTLGIDYFTSSYFDAPAYADRDKTIDGIVAAVNEGGEVWRELGSGRSLLMPPLAAPERLGGIGANVAASLECLVESGLLRRDDDLAKGPIVTYVGTGKTEIDPTAFG